MKKTIIIIALMAISTLSFAQAKKDTAKTIAPVPAKKEFKLNPEKLYQLPLFTYDEIQLLTQSPDDAKSIEWSDRVSGLQIQQWKAAADAVRKKVAVAMNELIKTEQAKFSADTAAAMTTADVKKRAVIARRLKNKLPRTDAFTLIKAANAELAKSTKNK
ncbi:hypothetical protein [Mucilaginibacter sp.]|uniref:hypothetical protein n=1 Tax=Mucilaginibacter sp. TaxID=1882438 RepID=UPI0026069C3C|nr:hypothetical protein [Mucilaginibacter sp.]MDB4919852.1 hypothetical protein [Mucilaginibacter sp.]